MNPWKELLVYLLVVAAVQVFLVFTILVLLTEIGVVEW